MIELDGSIGYGQILRTAIAISSITLKPIKIFNIRINRPQPGLRPQHLTGVLEAAKLCKAEVKGAYIGSKEIFFIPKKLEIPQKIFIDIKTAGSITLLLQTLIPILIFSKNKTFLTIKGGTDTSGAPTITYYQKVFLYYLKLLGIDIKISVEKYGFYPKGNGIVHVEVNPVEKIKPLKLIERGNFKNIESYSIASRELEKNKVAERQINGLESIVGSTFRNIKYVDTLSIGSSLLALSIYESCILGKDGLGEKGKRAEDVGKEVGLELKKSIESKACLDKFMSDQILLFVALANGSSEFTIEKFTEHVKTNILVNEILLGVKFEVENNLIKVKGIGF
ncbi:MAG: RNA 3'-terminal phosphate cyclase [Candidatus Aenigmarchaeota archaeon]|nr:RNA 3'-terminal phosphate cyclase [Candidatus Aenigmarchaeota archaeon]MDW8149141.1 RNA 3'-terminal phosphate cyclase [Candidatus Aenigmarchaeota archaeon]